MSFPLDLEGFTLLHFQESDREGASAQLEEESEYPLMVSISLLGVSLALDSPVTPPPS